MGAGHPEDTLAFYAVTPIAKVEGCLMRLTSWSPSGAGVFVFKRALRRQLRGSNLILTVFCSGATAAAMAAG